MSVPTRKEETDAAYAKLTPYERWLVIADADLLARQKAMEEMGREILKDAGELFQRYRDEQANNLRNVADKLFHRAKAYQSEREEFHKKPAAVEPSPPAEPEKSNVNPTEPGKEISKCWSPAALLNAQEPPDQCSAGGAV